MIKNLSKLESIVEGKVGQFLVESDTPLGVVKEMLFQFTSYVAQFEAQLKADLEKQQASQPVQEETEENPK